LRGAGRASQSSCHGGEAGAGRARRRDFPQPPVELSREYRG
jgi:hypothetical protein